MTFSVRSIGSNVVAGCVVAVVALPLAMAFAIASGARPENGLYTAIIAGIVVVTCGGSRVQISGPTGAFIVILAGITAAHGFAGLAVASFMAGGLLVLMSAARLGRLIRHIPVTVIAGFTAGIAAVIWVGEWKDFFGLPAAHAGGLPATIVALLASLPHANLATAAAGCACLAILIVTPRIPVLARIPGPLIALVLSTAIEAVAPIPGVATIGSAFGGIPRTLPVFGLPHVAWPIVAQLIGPAIAIALLGAIESLLSAVVADRLSGTQHDPDRELLGQGLANLIAPLAGGFACTGAIARTATNIRNGGTNALASIVHSLVLILIVVALAPAAAHIPLATLAAILFVVAYNMFDVAHLRALLAKASRVDVAIVAVTFTLTILTSLVIAVAAGVALSVLANRYLGKNATRNRMSGDALALRQPQ